MLFNGRAKKLPSGVKIFVAYTKTSGFLLAQLIKETLMSAWKV
jgi:hypothetical protein